MSNQQKSDAKEDILKPQTILQETYIIHNLIREGPVSRMYKAENITTNKVLAIKELLMDKFTNPAEKKQALEQFHLEAKILLRLKHQNLAMFEDYFEFNGRRYLIMEYIKGEKLNIITEKTEGFLQEGQVVEWGLELCDVLEYLHTRKPSPIIFRDLCPENVILSEESKLKLIDFGISKLFDPKSRTLAVAKTANVNFSPMEQYIAQTDERTDIYSLGATLYFLLTKKLPVDALDRSFNNLPLAPCRKFNSAITPELEKIILKAMNLEQNDRYPNILDMRKALVRCRVEDTMNITIPQSDSFEDNKIITMDKLQKCDDDKLLKKEEEISDDRLIKRKDIIKLAGDKGEDAKKETGSVAPEEIEKKKNRTGFIEGVVVFLIDFLEKIRNNLQEKKKK